MLAEAVAATDLVAEADALVSAVAVVGVLVAAAVGVEAALARGLPAGRAVPAFMLQPDSSRDAASVSAIHVRVVRCVTRLLSATVGDRRLGSTGVWYRKWLVVASPPGYSVEYSEFSRQP